MSQTETHVVFVLPSRRWYCGTCIRENSCRMVHHSRDEAVNCARGHASRVQCFAVTLERLGEPWSLAV